MTVAVPETEGSPGRGLPDRVIPKRRVLPSFGGQQEELETRNLQIFAIVQHEREIQINNVLPQLLFV